MVKVGFQMFEQAAIAVVDSEKYEQLHAIFDAAFATGDVELLLSKVSRSGLQIRDFAGILGRGLLGKQAAGLYAALPLSDQALTRERYLELLEAVPAELRMRYRKAYTQY